MVIYCSCNQILPCICPVAHLVLMRLQENSVQANKKREMWKVVDSKSTSHFQREMVQIVRGETLVANGCRSAAKHGLFDIISKSFFLFGRRDINDLSSQLLNI